jgi:hypothetical protein
LDRASFLGATRAGSAADLKFQQLVAQACVGAFNSKTGTRIPGFERDPEKWVPVFP